MDWTKYSMQQLQEALPDYLDMADIKDWNMLQNTFFIQEMNEKPSSPVFRLLHEIYNRLGYEEYVLLIKKWENFFSSQQKKTFLNLVLEPRYLSESTQHFINNRHQALELYVADKTSFSLTLEKEEDNPYDSNAILVYAEGRRERITIGYISRSFNIRINELLKQNPFPFIQTNYEDILNGKYSEDNVIIDIFF